MRYLLNIEVAITMFSVLFGCPSQNRWERKAIKNTASIMVENYTKPAQYFDTSLYNLKMKQLANGDKSGRWPPQTIYPGKDALFPYKRVVAYYGNFYSTGMGILGQYTPKLMLKKLKDQVTE